MDDGTMTIIHRCQNDVDDDGRVSLYYRENEIQHIEIMDLDVSSLHTRVSQDGPSQPLYVSFIIQTI